jgi:hypothetical protein
MAAEGAGMQPDVATQTIVGMTTSRQRSWMPGRRTLTLKFLLSP